MMKLFISQPMRGKTEEEILAVRKKAVESAESVLLEKVETLEEMLAHLEQVRRQGYATDCEEFGNGITCVAAPIRDYTGAVVGAVGCSAFTLSADSEAVVQRLLPDVLAAAREISVCLGAELS